MSSVDDRPNFNRSRFFNPDSANARAVVGVSACLLGQPVRYDGGDKYLHATAMLQAELTLIPICPEVGAGLAVPRPPVRLVNTGGGMPRALGRDDATLDVTEALYKFARGALSDARTQRLCGYIWKSKSPSCGMGSTPVIDAQGHAAGRSSGIQAAHFLRDLPWLSYCEETELAGVASIARFILRCRLVFDLTEALGNSPLSALDRHYHFLHERFDATRRTELESSREQGNIENYLTAFQHGCGHLVDEELLDLFRH